jgi:fibronectin-binding autotransporter adhesin
LNFVGKFDAKLPVDGPVAHSAMHAHVDGTSAHAPSDAIIVPDAQLLFGGEFKRTGVDLVLSDDHHELVLHDYFKGEKRVALASPDGAHLTGDLVNALAGHVEVAQADGAVAAAVVVGHVTKLTGTATAIRNGVSIILNQGDNIDKGDVLQSAADSTLGVTFIDGTVFGLSSNARMVVNEMIYDPNGSNNSSLLSLVAGTISFVAGETAKHGDMKVDTPVATMGIRGTAVLVEIDFDVPGQNGTPSANFQVLVEPDGTTGSYILFDKNTLAPLATVNTAGTLTKISQGIVSFEAGSPLTSDQQKLITELFTTKFGDSNTKSLFDHFTDSVIPQSLQPVYLPGGVTVTPIVLLATNALGSPPSTPSGLTFGEAHIPGAPHVNIYDQSFSETPGVTGSHTPHTLSAPITFTDPNSGDRPTVTVDFTSFSYQDAHGHDITAALSPQEQAAIAAVEGISLQTVPGNNNNGSAIWTYSFPDGAFDFLGAGETLTLTYTALVADNYASSPETGTATFTITITGTNDVPVITSSAPQTIAFVGGIHTVGGDLTAHVPTSGTISFDDPDLTDTHTVAVQLLTTGLPPLPQLIFEKALTASIAADSTGTGLGTINWKLADLPVYLADFIPAGQTITLTYEVTVTDSQGATATQDITVTITGNDTPAVVWIATTTTGQPSGGLWSDGLNWETGAVPTATDDVIIITDQLIGLTPSYPVTIDANTAAMAKSVTMNDFGTSPPELINLGSLTISGAFDMSADSILHNSGTISVGGLMEVLDTSVLQNSATLTLEAGGDFAATTTITNTGTIEVSGGTLTVEADIANTGGTVVVDGAATLTLDSGAIDGGTIDNSGNIDVSGLSAISNAHLNNGHVTLGSNATLTLDNDMVTGTSFADTASGSVIQVDDGTTLTLSGVHITGGTINDGTATGSIDITGDSTISGASLNHGGVTIEANQTLTLDSDTVTGTSFIDTASGATILIDGSATLDEVTIIGGTITNTGATLTIDAGQMLTLQGGASLVEGTLDNSGTLEIEGSSGATLDGVTITGSGSIEVDVTTAQATPTLVLDGGTSITSGTLTVGSSGTLDVKTARGATLHGVNVTNDNSIEVFAGSVLILDQLTTVDNSTGTISIDGTGMLTLDDASISGGTINDYSTDASDNIVAGDIDVTASSMISDAHLINGQVTIGSGVVLTLDLDTVTGTHFSDTGATIQIDGDTTLTLDGATINGGTINDYSPGASDSIIAGDIDIIGDSTISDASLNHGKVTIESGEKLTLDGDTVNGTAFTNIATGSVIHVDGGDTLTLNDATTITGGGLTIDADALVKTSGDVTLTNTSVTNDGKIEVTGGILKITGSVDSTPGDHGSIQIDNGAVLDLNGSDTQGVVFAGDGGKLEIDTPSVGGSISFGGSISGLTAGDEIDLSTIGYGLNTTGTYVSNAAHTGGVLTITDGMHSISMTLVGDYSDAHFAGSTDDSGGTLITLNATDDAPAFAPADKSETATVMELPNTTGSSALDPSPAASGTLDFTDIDLTDRPTATVTQSVSWTEGTTSLTSNEVQALEHAFTLTQSGNTNNGSLGWTYQISDAALDFLGAGVTATVTSTVTLNDHQGGTDTATVTVTIDGANDLPVIVGETNPAPETIILHTSPTVLSAGTSTNSLGMNTETFDSLTAGSASNNGLGHGDFTSTALDATFTASGDAGIVHGSSSVSAAPFIGPSPGQADAINYLSIGAHGSETITFGSEQNEFGLYWGSADSFNTVSFYDGNNLVASYSGTDVAPLLANGNQGSFASNGYVEFSDLAPFDKVVLASGSSNAFEIDNISSGFVSDSHVHLASPISGTLTVSDADIGDTLTASVTGNGVAEYNGSTTLPSDANVSALIASSAITFDTVQTTGGHDVLDWTYNPTNADLDFLEPGDTLTLAFNATVSDGHATTAVQPLTVTLVGNGAAVVNGTAQSQTFANIGGGVTIFGNGGQDNFVFNKNFGSATIGDFNVNTDTIDIDHSLFANVATLLQGAQTVGHDTIITDAAHDKLTLTGVTLAQLHAHQSDFHFI